MSIAILAAHAVLATITLAANAGGIGRPACALVSRVANVAANTANSSDFGFVSEWPTRVAGSVLRDGVGDGKNHEARKIKITGRSAYSTSMLTLFEFRQGPEVLASMSIAILATHAVLATITLAANAGGIGRPACALMSRVANVAANTASW